MQASATRAGYIFNRFAVAVTATNERSMCLMIEPEQAQI
jgi:hypothetical protein